MNRLYLSGRALADPVSYLHGYDMAYPKPSPTSILCSVYKENQFPFRPAAQLLGSLAADERLASTDVRLEGRPCRPTPPLHLQAAVRLSLFLNGRRPACPRSAPAPHSSAAGPSWAAPPRELASGRLSIPSQAAPRCPYGRAPAPNR